jgi:hypothetical protein
MKEENVLLQGLGLNASYKRLEEKGEKYNVFKGNETKESRTRKGASYHGGPKNSRMRNQGATRKTTVIRTR